MAGVAPKVAALFLKEHPEVDRNCSISLEEVVKCFRPKKRETVKSCSPSVGQKFCKCEKCVELKKLYRNLNGRKRYKTGEPRTMKLNYRHLDRRAGDYYY